MYTNPWKNRDNPKQYKLITVRDVTYLLPDTMSLLLHLHILLDKARSLSPWELQKSKQLSWYGTQRIKVELDKSKNKGQPVVKAQRRLDKLVRKLVSQVSFFPLTNSPNSGASQALWWLQHLSKLAQLLTRAVLGTWSRWCQCRRASPTPRQLLQIGELALPLAWAKQESWS